MCLAKFGYRMQQMVAEMTSIEISIPMAISCRGSNGEVRGKSNFAEWVVIIAL